MMRDDSVLNRIFPHVDMLGTCDNFEKDCKHGCCDDTCNCTELSSSSQEASTDEDASESSEN